MKIATNCIIKKLNLPSSFLQTTSEAIKCSTLLMKDETKSRAYFNANKPFSRWSRSLETNKEQDVNICFTHQRIWISRSNSRP